MKERYLKHPPRSAPLPDREDREKYMQALRRCIIHLLVMEPYSENWLGYNVRTSSANVLEVVQKIARQNEQGRWVIMDRPLREIDPWCFPYKTDEERQKAIDNTIKAFDRLRIPKEDDLWQKLLKPGTRYKGIYLSRLHVQAPSQKESKPAPKITKATEKKPAQEKKIGPGKKAQEKTQEKEGEKGTRKAKE